MRIIVTEEHMKANGKYSDNNPIALALNEQTALTWMVWADVCLGFAPADLRHVRTLASFEPPPSVRAFLVEHFTPGRHHAPYELIFSLDSFQGHADAFLAPSRPASADFVAMVA